MTKSIRGRSFRLYSFATLVIMVVFGVVTSLTARGLGTGEPTPWFGLMERINIGAFLLWVVVLAISLLRVQQPTYYVARLGSLVLPVIEKMAEHVEIDVVAHDENKAGLVAKHQPR